VVNISSSVGSLARMMDPHGPYAQLVSVGYPTSKTALNAVTVAFAKELRDTPIKVNAACPGYTATDLTQHRGPRTAEQAAAIAVRPARRRADGPTGAFFEDAGVVPW